MAIAVLIALLIALAIVLRDVDANPRNTIVKGIHDGANFFAGAFTGLVTFKGHAKREITVDWGIALLVYLIVGAVIARSIQRLGYRGLRYRRGGSIAALRAAVAAQAILTFDEKLQTPRDLADIPVVVQELTGSHYTTL